MAWYAERYPLHLAVWRGDLELIEMLSTNPDFTRLDNVGMYPVHCAVWKRDLRVLQCLVRHGADINATTRMGQTPLGQAQSMGHVEVATWLSEHGAR